MWLEIDQPEKLLGFTHLTAGHRKSCLLIARRGRVRHWVSDLALWKWLTSRNIVREPHTGTSDRTVERHARRRTYSSQITLPLHFTSRQSNRFHCSPTLTSLSINLPSFFNDESRYQGIYWTEFNNGVRVIWTLGSIKTSATKNLLTGRNSVAGTVGKLVVG